MLLRATDSIRIRVKVKVLLPLLAPKFGRDNKKKVHPSPPSFTQLILRVFFFFNLTFFCYNRPHLHGKKKKTCQIKTTYLVGGGEGMCQNEFLIFLIFFRNARIF